MSSIALTRARSHFASRLQEIEKKIEDLKNFCTELRKEIQQRVQEKRILREDLEVLRRSVVKEDRELETLKTEMEQQKVKLTFFQNSSIVLASQCCLSVIFTGNSRLSQRRTESNCEGV